MNRLFIDAGNTRIKWAMQQDATWTVLPPLSRGQSGELARMTAELPEVDSVWVSNVAGEAVAAGVVGACASRSWPVHFIGAQARQCGVTNGYEFPERLGSDRWAALIAARRLADAAALVVNCGTATTIDALSRQGVFRGGLIVPGLALMQDSLQRHTAQLSASAGRYAAFPNATADAIYSGALQATAGAIERQYALLEDPGAVVLLGGGAAHLIREYLQVPVRPVEDMVLQGISLIAAEAGKK